MKLSVNGMTITLALVWGLAMLLTGVVNVIWPSYGRAFLDAMASVYPGYSGAATGVQVIVGTLYGVLDGAIAGALIAWLYNRFARA